jgi:hypothetical protein
VHKGYPKNIVVLLLTLGCTTLCAQSQSFLPINSFRVNTVGDEQRTFNKTLNVNTVPGNAKTSQSTFVQLKVAATGGINLLPSPSSTAQKQVTATVVSEDIYVKNFGFFCRKELQVEKTLRVPLRLRLGSLEQCNRLEQK